MTEAQQIFLTSLRDNLGIVEPALIETGTNRNDFNAWLKDNSNFADEVSKINELKREFLEAQLFKHAKDGNMQALDIIKKDLQTKTARKWYEL